MIENTVVGMAWKVSCVKICHKYADAFLLMPHFCAMDDKSVHQEYWKKQIVGNYQGIAKGKRKVVYIFYSYLCQASWHFAKLNGQSEDEGQTTYAKWCFDPHIWNKYIKGLFYHKSATKP